MPKRDFRHKAKRHSIVGPKCGILRHTGRISLTIVPGKLFLSKAGDIFGFPSLVEPKVQDGETYHHDLRQLPPSRCNSR